MGPYIKNDCNNILSSFVNNSHGFRPNICWLLDYFRIFVLSQKFNLFKEKYKIAFGLREHFIFFVTDE